MSCAHTFATSQGHAYARFRRYLDAGQMTNALAAAYELHRISLSDSLKLCELLARERDSRFPRAASRWLARFAADASLEDVQLAAAALTHLAADPNSEVAQHTLRQLLN